jgi:hypothetical protein
VRAGVETPHDDRPTASRRSQAVSRATPPYAIEVARVLSRDHSEALIDVDGRQASAGIAIPPPTTIEAGDLVVVIGDTQRWWVVGTLGGHSGPGDAALPVLTAAPDLRMHCPRGRITLAAPRIRIGGGTASLAAATLRATARSCLLRCQTAHQRVMGRLARTLGELVQCVTGHYRRRSREIHARAEGPVIIKGSRISLN